MAAFISIFTNAMFFAALLAALIVSICMYVSAKIKNSRAPDTFTPSQIRGRLVFMVVMCVVFGVLVLVSIGLITLLYMAVAYM